MKETLTWMLLLQRVSAMPWLEQTDGESDQQAPFLPRASNPWGDEPLTTHYLITPQPTSLIML